MLVRTCHAVGFLVTAVPIDSLDGVVLSSSCSRMTQGKACAGCQYTKRLRWWPPGLARCEEIVCGRDVVLRSFESRIFRAFLGGFCRVFRDLDFHIAEISLTGSSLAFSLLRIIGLGRSRRPPFQTTIPIMGHEGFPFITLCRSMGVNIVDVGEVCIKPEQPNSQETLSNVWKTHSSSVKVMVSSTLNNLSLHFSRSGGFGMSFKPPKCPPSPFCGV
jgi:hypothetical protein